MIAHQRWILSVGFVCAATCATAHADRIVLRGGGELQGVVLPPDPARPEIVRIQTRTGLKPLEFRKAQVLRIDPEEDDLSEYLKQRDKVEQTADAQFELGEWCDQAGLTGPAQGHYQRAIELDAEHEPAHKKLGHVYHNGRWMTYDDRRKAQGLLQHKGRWVSPDEKEALEAKTAYSAEQESWSRQLKLLRKKLYSSDPQQVQQAELQLAGIREPAAVAPLLKVFGSDAEPVRIRLARTIAAIPGDDTTEALVRMILAEPTLTVREVILNELSTIKDPEIIPRLIRALGGKNPVVVGRAAWALAQLGATQAVPKLIPVLIKTETKWMLEPVGGDPAITAGFVGIEGTNRMPGNAGALAAGGNTATTGAGFANGSSLGVLTGPVVGDGVVAYGATSMPFGNYSGLNLGGNPNRPAARFVTNVYRNEEVLYALQKLTGVDFGYDVAAWKQYVATGFRAENAPQRRVLQP